MGGKAKLTDRMIDRLQNYYGIAIRSNVGTGTLSERVGPQTLREFSL